MPGKSCVKSMLCRFHDIQAGAIGEVKEPILEDLEFRTSTEIDIDA